MKQKIETVRAALPLLVGGQFRTTEVNDPWDMMGPRYKSERQKLMSALLGRKAKATESGVVNICETLCEFLGLDHDRKLPGAIQTLRMERGEA